MCPDKQGDGGLPSTPNQVSLFSMLSMLPKCGWLLIDSDRAGQSHNQDTQKTERPRLDASLWTPLASYLKYASQGIQIQFQYLHSSGWWFLKTNQGKYQNTSQL